MTVLGLYPSGNRICMDLWLLKHLHFGHIWDSNRAQPGQARCPTGVSTVPNMGKHRAQNKDKYCLFINTK